MAQEPDLIVAQGTAEDGVRGQQKIFELGRGEHRGSRGHPREVVITEAELNRFLSRNLVEVVRMPVTVRAVRLAGDGIAEFKGLLALRAVLSGSPFASITPAAWLERPIWLHIGARASVEVGAARGQRRYLRFEVQRFAIGRQPLPRVVLRLLPSSGLQGLLRWRIPESVESITIDPGAAVVRTAS
jgi:hypothetical protein